MHSICKSSKKMEVSQKIRFLPHEPGVYRFFDSEGTVIYVGKAKDLNKRVSSYFRPPETLTRKTRVMVSHIADMTHTVVESEQDALLLENNLIKQFQPRYNILLKDSKSYPWICVRNEPFPRVHITRRFVRDGSQYFGPYSSVMHAHRLMDLIDSLWKVRTCKNLLSEENIRNHKFRPCLNSFIEKCDAPCDGRQSKEEYDSQISDIVSLLKGNVASLIRENREAMKQAASELRFEDAQLYKERVEMLENHYSKSLVVSQTMSDTDAFTILTEGSDAYCNFIRVREGCIVQSFNLCLKCRIEEEPSTILSTFMGEIITTFGPLSKEVLVPFIPDETFEGVDLHIPQRGEKAGLLELSRRNAAALKNDRMKQEEHLRPEEHREKILEALKRDLGMSKLPRHIECFDNSNLQGTNPVASCVVFRDGVPSKKDYRHFNIKTVTGANDFASMKEVVNRRYSRLMTEGEELPQLVVVDGGRGQLTFAVEALEELGLMGEIFICGLAKRFEEVILPDDPTPLFLDKNSSSLKVLMHIRDEAHRFGITHHRGQRGKSMLESELDTIKGVGKVTAIKLIKEFKSVAQIKKASLEALQKGVGNHMGKLVYDHFHKEA